MKMRIRCKLQTDRDFEPTLRFKTKVWVHMPDGQYFYLHEGHIRQWYQMFALYMDYPNMDDAILAALHTIYERQGVGKTFRRLRSKERVYHIKVTPAPKPG